MRKLLVATAVAAVLVPASAFAGGWATVKLDSTPTGSRAGVAWVVTMTVLQHGRTPLAGIEPYVRITQGTTMRTFHARPLAKVGLYRARVVFPKSGTWRWAIWDGFSRTHTYSAVKVAPVPL